MSKTSLSLVRLFLIACLFFNSYNAQAEELSAKKDYKQILAETKQALEAKTAVETIKTEPVVNKTIETTTKTIQKTEEIVIMKSEEMQEVKKEQGKVDTIVVMETEKGTIRIKLYMEEAPITAGNFKDLVERKFYNGLNFHRIISGFVVQGGCPLGNGTGNFIDPETKKTRYIKHEMPDGLRHSKAGILAMARTADPNSASSQFFIDLAPLPSLDPGDVDPYGYAVFGEVIDGMDVVNKIVKENVAPYPGSDGTANPVKMLSVRIEE